MLYTGHNMREIIQQLKNNFLYVLLKIAIVLFFILLTQELIVLARYNRLWVIHEYQCIVSYKFQIRNKSATNKCLNGTVKSIIVFNRYYFGEKYRNLEENLWTSTSFNIKKSQAIIDWIDQKELWKFLKSEQANLSQYYYLAAIGDDNSSNEAISMYANSILLNPELSFMYLELSDELIRARRLDTANSILTACQQFHYPSDDCGIKMSQIADPQYEPNPRGSLNQAIESYYRLQI